jgi:hypothetical protein
MHNHSNLRPDEFAREEDFATAMTGTKICTKIGIMRCHRRASAKRRDAPSRRHAKPRRFIRPNFWAPTPLRKDGAASVKLA